MKKIILTSTTEETELAGKEFAASLSLGDFVAMRGDLGVGKTAFIRGMAQHLAPRARVQSPTYQIVNEYRGGKIPFYHFDMYRISGEEDLESTGFYEYLDDESNLIIEWSENIVEEIPEDAVYIHIEKGENENDRVISVGVMKEYGGR